MTFTEFYDRLQDAGFKQQSDGSGMWIRPADEQNRELFVSEVATDEMVAFHGDDVLEMLLENKLKEIEA